MPAVAYIRRSHSGEAQASEQLQRDTVARLAAERGDAITRVFKDWGRSGGSETRPEYLAMLAQAEAGGVSTIYAYDQDPSRSQCVAVHGTAAYGRPAGLPGHHDRR